MMQRLQSCPTHRDSLFLDEFQTSCVATQSKLRDEENETQHMFEEQLMRLKLEHLQTQNSNLINKTKHLLEENCSTYVKCQEAELNMSVLKKVAEEAVIVQFELKKTIDQLNRELYSSKSHLEDIEKNSTMSQKNIPAREIKEKELFIEGSASGRYDSFAFIRRQFERVSSRKNKAKFLEYA